MTRTTYPGSGSAQTAETSFLAGLLEQDGTRHWHVLATNDGRWFYSVERFPETGKADALRYVSLVQPGRESNNDTDERDRTIFHHPV